MESRHPKQISSILPKNLGLHKLIQAKREWNWKPSVEELKRGFRGWYQRGYLPHFDAPNVTQMVTIMLVDSFPIKRRSEWESILKENDHSAKRGKLETWLDRGHGECWLRRPAVAQIVEQALLNDNGNDFRIQAWVLMPNHIHLVVDVWNVPLVKLIHAWKGRSSRTANKLLGRRGKFWQADYFDTLVRDTDQLRKAIHYIEQNPVKAYSVKTSREWIWSSARRRDEFGRLP